MNPQGRYTCGNCKEAGPGQEGGQAGPAKKAAKRTVKKAVKRAPAKRAAKRTVKKAAKKRAPARKAAKRTVKKRARRELPPAEPFQPASPPGAPLLAGEGRRAARLAPGADRADHQRAGQALPTLAPAVNTLVGNMLGLNRGDGAVIATRPGRAPATPFNKPITPHRRFAFRSVDLATVKMVKNAFGVSVNDVVMAMCAGALRRWLIDHDALPDQPLIAMIPRRAFSNDSPLNANFRQTGNTPKLVHEGQ